MENFELKGFAKGKKQQKEQVGGNAIIYTRVSSSEQVDGQSLEVQRDKCREYANMHSYNIVGEFGGTYESAKSDKERKEFSRMLAFIKQSNKKGSSQVIKTVIVFSTSRFSRTGSTTIIEEVEARGAYVVSATSNYDPRTPVGKYMQLMELANARFQNDEKRATTVENSVKALLKGRWIGKAPRGYDQKTTKKEQIITINEEGKQFKKIFTIHNNDNEYKKLLDEIKAAKKFFNDRNVLIGIESTGVYSKALYNYLGNKLGEVVLINPILTSMFELTEIDATGWTSYYKG